MKSVRGATKAVLGIVHPALTMRVVDDVRSSDSFIRPILLVPEIDAWRFENHDHDVWILGEEHISFEPRELSNRLLEANVDEVVIPLGVPRRQLAFVARWVGSTDAPRFALRRSRITIRRRAAVVVVLWLLHLLVRLPTSVVLRVSRHLDGVLVVATAQLLRLLPRRDSVPSGGVCHVITHVGTGGAQRQLLEYLQWVTNNERQSDVFLAALFGGNRSFLSPLRATGIEITIIEDRFDGSTLGRALMATFPTMSVITGLGGYIRGSKPKCLYSWLFMANVVSGIVGRLARVPRVVASELTLNRWKAEKGTGRWWYRSADRAAAPLWDVIVTNSEAAADDFATWARVPREPICVIRNGIDFDAFLATPTRDVRALHGIPAHEILVLSVGRFSPEKNHDLLLRAAAVITNEGLAFRIVLVGHGSEEDGLRDRASQLGISDRVVFAGHVPDPQSYYAAADVFVLPSLIESLPNALIESQAFGLPAVTTDVGGAADVVENGVTGWIVASDQERLFADALARLINEGDVRRRMSRSARRRVRSRFGIDRMCHSIEQLSTAERP